MKRKPEEQLTKQAVEAGEEPSREEPVESGVDIGERKIYKAKRRLPDDGKTRTTPLFSGLTSASAGEPTKATGEPTKAISEPHKGDAANGANRESPGPAGATDATAAMNLPSSVATADDSAERVKAGADTEGNVQALAGTEAPALEGTGKGGEKITAVSAEEKHSVDVVGDDATVEQIPESADADNRVHEENPTQGETTSGENANTNAELSNAFGASSEGASAMGTNSNLFNPTRRFTFSDFAPSSEPFSFPIASLNAAPQAPSESAAPLFSNRLSDGNSSSTAPLREQNISNGEEEEEEQFRGRAKLYELEANDSKTQWKERGVGNLKLNVHKETHKARLIMRSEGSLRLVLNASLWGDFNLNRANEKNVRFCCIGEDSQLANYLVKFPLKEDLDKLVLAVDKWRESGSA
eukprot:Plantae.Rhodophyta-Purpureofilum_apyrenoidigerum.ctg4580.p1 GENE.Plantae.Rhodophyta-Purpureofilum_apyrenoidigerum.ctg4580~~Plantae.Rhodophyta-Purpureofilum_apyrenoidigerum.ctg4580.p1  ORF type:complete len:411 (+),score=83.83 Plantae.Rhodophyta-Purpureofilum_apyrenoidigerum.ctg4580:393-1625(+)